MTSPPGLVPLAGLGAAGRSAPLALAGLGAAGRSAPLALAGLGALAGFGLLLVAAARRRPNGDLVRSPTGRQARPESLPRGQVPALAAAGHRIERLATKLGTTTRRACDLAVTGRDHQSQAVVTALGAVLGLLSVPVAFGAARLLGLRLPLSLVPEAAVAAAAAGVLLPAIALRRAAKAARAAFRRSLSCWLELVVLAQAGGMGPEGALDAASRLTGDPAFDAIRTTLASARETGSPPWLALARLGQELGIEELNELAASISLAGSEGARVRSSLAAKAASLRRKQLAEAAADANATTERLFLPSIVLMLGFLVFLMYPAAVSLGHVL